MRVTGFLDTATRVISAALVVALLATGVLWYTLQRGTQREITTYFTSTVGLYKNNTVDVQGVAVGLVGDIVPQGPLVRVTLKVDNDVAIPADAKAVIIAPTLVSDRYVQLGPTYTGGPVMADGAIIPPSRTAVPVELDAVYQSLDTIATALGPNGANQTGALNQLLRSSSNALGGNGDALKQTITQVAGAVGTLSDNRQNLFATVDNLGQFTNTLASNDGNVRALNIQLQDISAFLASERGNLSEVLRVLPPALADVARFIRDNRDILRTDVGQLADVTDTLVRQRQALTELAEVAPLALGNLTNVYNASSGTLDVRPILAPNLGLALDPRALLCGLLNPTGPAGAAISGPLAALPATDAVGALGAAATTLCTQLLNPAALTTALAPFQQLQNAIATQLGQAAPTQALAANLQPLTTLRNGAGTTAAAPATPTTPSAPIVTEPGGDLLNGSLPGMNEDGS